MDSREAKSILSIYRPGIDDDDPQFAEALAEAERDPELRMWLFEQGKSYNDIREKLRTITVPDDLRQKIVGERPIVFHRPTSPLKE